MTDAVDARDYPQLLAAGESVLDEVTGLFVDGLGSPGTHAKGRGDFATDVDLALERSIAEKLERRTGIEVHGEEFGGPAPDDGAMWILDPIDGTFNYSVGMPIAAMLLALAVDGVPVLGLTRLPLVGQRFAGHIGGPLIIDGEAAEPVPDSPLESAVIGFGSFNARARGEVPGAARAELQRRLSYRAGRLRMTGSTGTDIAYAAAGVFGGAVSFSAKAWDNAAGAALMRAAGGVVTDLAGDPWTVQSTSLVAGNRLLHGQLLEVIGEAMPDQFADRDLGSRERTNSKETHP
ncbi:inositol monophosphatase [Gordonia sihwensis]|uniref:inositol monophosphatase family protein n=1 Tax=Gordonia TaxID=2053 RepID=UPI000783CA94|nr:MULTISPECIES: inositol monophosphatase family protein [Gordonia]KXT56254.1 inositol monophosphatase [Gordonia sp. QH-12]MBY4570543.1 inositol monophosphatase [Gordonia sihwensis]